MQNKGLQHYKKKFKVPMNGKGEGWIYFGRSCDNCKYKGVKCGECRHFNKWEKKK